MKRQSGLRVVLRPAAETQPQYHSFPVMLLMLSGTSLTACDLFPSAPLPWWALFLSLMGFYVLLWTAALTGKGRLVCGGVMVALALFCLLCHGRVLSGLGALGNDLTPRLMEFSGQIHLDLAAGAPRDILWGLLPLLTLWVTLLQLSILTGKSLWCMPALLILWLAVLVGFVSITSGVLLLGIGTLLLVMRRGNGLPSWLPVVLLCAAVAGGVALAVGNTEGRLTNWEGIAHDLLYHEDSPSMPEGNLKNLSPWEPEETPALKLTMSQPQKVYLRGAVYETYTASGWTTLSAEERVADADLFYWLHQSNFFGQSQIATASALVSREEPVQLTVETLSACSGHGYLPYGLADSGALDASLIGDAVFPAVEEMQCLPGSLPEWYGVQQALASAQGRENVSDYLAVEESYEAYVTRHDLQLTNESWSVLQRHLSSDGTSRTLSEIRTIIRDYLSQTLVYDETVQTLNGNGDFLQYTLEKSGSGYSVHYATAAVLMLRYFGVPARYVEGYFLSASEAADYAPGESIILTEENAHAWAEYYLPGVGFVPFEVTPGYLDDEELELGGSLEMEEQTYTGEHLKYAQVEQPEQIRDPEQSRTSFAAKPEWLLWLLLPVLAVFATVIFRKRAGLKRALRAMADASNREAIAMGYGYAAALMDTCPALVVAGGAEAAELNQEALFSTHEMTADQRRRMEAFTQTVLQQCRTQWTWGEKLRYRFWDCLY